jgi:cytochrome d ubiquinol oxidase subunit I
MELDVLVLSRVQFALTIMFHYIFPPLSIGLATLMAIMEGIYLRTGNRQYHVMTRFWTGLFAVNFAMGVATGIVMEFQFGTNWAHYARHVGDIFGSALAAEGIFAFFLESGFLAVLVFGWDRVSPRTHFIATVMVALGSIFSAVWIVIANSWQQTPAGFAMQGDRAVISDFWAMIFNPSSMIRLAHVLLAAFLLGAFFVMSISAYYLLRNRHLEFARKSFTLALLVGMVTSVAMPITGHFHAKVVARTQPAKLAALEGHWKTGVADLYLIGWPVVNERKEVEIKYGLAIPAGLTFLVHDDFTTPITGLEEFHPDDRPPVVLPFLTFHLMVVLGIFFIGLCAAGLFFRWRGTLFQKRWLLWVFVVAVLGPYLANQAGWVSAEVGRQPFVVYPAGVNVAVKESRPVGEDGTKKEFVKMDYEPRLRTADGVSNRRVVTGGQVLTSIVLFSVIYLLLFAIWVYVLHTKIQHGPDEAEPPPPEKTTREGYLTATSRLAPASGDTLVKPGTPTGPGQ